MALRALILLGLCYPMGIGLQNLALLISSGLLATQSYKKHLSAFHARIGFWLSIAFVLWMIVSTLLNPAQEMVWQKVVGYLGWVILPWLFAANFTPQTRSSLFKLQGFVVIVMAVWALVILSQFIWGWRVLGVSFVTDIPRPRGFYSHPLTLGYCLVFLIPFASLAVFHYPRRVVSWVFFISVYGAVFLNQSRMVSALAVVILALHIWFELRTKRLLICCLAALGLVALFGTHNPVSERVHRSFSDSPDRFSDYPDDRLAFWHAHWLMIQERPLLGHGGHLGTKFRLPYYERLGLGDFIRPYEAHNMYIQVLAQNGVIGLGLFISWLVWLYHQARQISHRFIGLASRQAIWVFALGGLTQNAFQDGEVRLGLSILAGIILIFSGSSQGERSSSNVSTIS